LAVQKARESPFAFKTSSGGGADPKRSGGGSAERELRNPTAHELGRHAKEIAAGEIKVVYE
jgi:hypothetical protein